MAATAVSKIAEWSVNGGKKEVWKFTLDLASIAAAAQGTDTVAVTGARAGDPVALLPQDTVNRLAPVGAKVTADDTVTLYFNNMYDATTAVDQASKTFHLEILKLAVGS